MYMQKGVEQTYRFFYGDEHASLGQISWKLHLIKNNKANGPRTVVHADVIQMTYK